MKLHLTQFCARQALPRACAEWPQPVPVMRDSVACFRLRVRGTFETAMTVGLISRRRAEIRTPAAMATPFRAVRQTTLAPIRITRQSGSDDSSIGRPRRSASGWRESRFPWSTIGKSQLMASTEGVLRNPFRASYGGAAIAAIAAEAAMTGQGGVLRGDRGAEPGAALGGHGRADYARARQAPAVPYSGVGTRCATLSCSPAASSAPRRPSAGFWCWRIRASGAPRASPPRSMPACNWCCPARSRPPTATASRRCASWSRAKAPTRRWTANARPWRRAISSSRPHWTWHDHGNDSDRPMIWLDGLDIPMVQFFDASFAERLGDEPPAAFASRGRQPRTLRPGPAAGGPGARLSGLAGVQLPLHPLARGAGGDAPARCLGPLPRPEASLCQPGGRQLRHAHHCRASAIASRRVRDRKLPLDGRGGLRGGRGQRRNPHRRGNGLLMGTARHLRRAELARRCGTAAGTDDAVLFSFSDRVVQEKLGLWREDRGNA